MKELPRLPTSVSALVPVGVRRRRWFRKTFGRRFRSDAVETFSEKVNWRILHDRRPLLEGTCDKLWMKQHAERLAPGLVRVPATLWVGTDLAELADVDLPEHWVLKPNHSTRRVVLGEGTPDVAALLRTTAGWLEEDLSARTGEWAYGTARRVFLVEEFIGRPGEVPADFKVFVFDGVPRVLQVHSARFAEHYCRVYTPGWEALPWYAGHPLGPEVPRPERLADMLAAAAVLAEGFDMLRVDFYEHQGVLWFGELTPYPGSGLTPLGPEMEEELGRAWTLPPRSSVRAG